MIRTQSAHHFAIGRAPTWSAYGNQDFSGPFFFLGLRIRPHPVRAQQGRPETLAHMTKKFTKPLAMLVGRLAYWAVPGYLCILEKPATD